MFWDCKGQLIVAAEASSLYFLSGVHADERWRTVLFELDVAMNGLTREVDRQQC
jgi:predicted 2-oxoglutarate/Fe(II)-dependent dioxygenase YbiX